MGIIVIFPFSNSDNDEINRHLLKLKLSEYYASSVAERVLKDFQCNAERLAKIGITAEHLHAARLPTKNTWRNVSGVSDRTDPSGGEAAANQLRDNGYQIYGWDVEWERNGIHPKETPEQMAAIVKDALKNKRIKKANKVIVLMHDDMFRSTQEDAVKLDQFLQLLKNDQEMTVQFDILENY